MAKIPKLSDLTDVQGMMNKVKSAIDNITGPGHSEIAQEALDKEDDPKKARLLEIELLISQLNDMHILYGKTLSNLKQKYQEVQKMTDELIEKTATSDQPDEPTKPDPQTKADDE